MTLARRSFLSGILALGCGPAIVRAASIMPVKVMPEWGTITFPVLPNAGDTLTINGVPLVFDEVSTFSQLTAITHKAFVPRCFEQIHMTSPMQKLLLYKELSHGDEACVLKPHQRGRV